MELELKRNYFPEGTNGILSQNGKVICNSIELPWKNNERGVSCIPEGKYLLVKRHSPKYGWHIEVTGVPNRSLILLHPANYALRELKGCIAPVSKLSSAGVGLQSRKATKKFYELVVSKLAVGEIVELSITS